MRNILMGVLGCTLLLSLPSCSILVSNKLDEKGGTPDAQMEARVGLESGPVEPDGGMPEDMPFHLDGMVPPAGEVFGPCTFVETPIMVDRPGRQGFQAALGRDGTGHLAYIEGNQLWYQSVDTTGHVAGRVRVAAGPIVAFAVAAGPMAAHVVFLHQTDDGLRAGLWSSAGGGGSILHTIQDEIHMIQASRVAAVVGAQKVIALFTGPQGALLVHGDENALNTCQLSDANNAPRGYGFPRLAVSPNGEFVAVSMFSESGDVTAERGWTMGLGEAADPCGLSLSSNSALLPPEFRPGPADVVVNDGGEPALAYVLASTVSSSPGLLMHVKKGEAPVLRAIGVSPEGFSFSAGAEGAVLAYRVEVPGQPPSRVLHWREPGHDGLPYGGPRIDGVAVMAQRLGPHLAFVLDAMAPGDPGRRLRVGRCDLMTPPFCDGGGDGPAGKRDYREDCDGMDYGGVSCESVAYAPGRLFCRDDCTVDVRDCGLLEHWPMEGGGQPNTREWFGRKQRWVATCSQGCASESGHHGRAVGLDGSGEITISNPGWLLSLDSFALGFSLNFASAGGVLGIGTDQGVTIGCSIEAEPNDDPQLVCTFTDAQGTGTSLKAGLGGGHDWHRVLLQGTAIDGQLIVSLHTQTDSFGASMPHHASTFSEIVFGRDPTRSGAPRLNGGGIDEVVIYDRTLSPREIAVYRHDPAPPIGPDMP